MITISDNTRNEEWILAGYTELNRNEIKIDDVYFVVTITTPKVRTEYLYTKKWRDACDFAVIHFEEFFVTIEKRKQIAPNAAIIEAIRTYFV